MLENYRYWMAFYLSSSLMFLAAWCSNHPMDSPSNWTVGIQPRLQQPFLLLDQGCKIQVLPNVELGALPIDHEPIELAFGLFARYEKHHRFPIQSVEDVPVLILHCYEILLAVDVGVRRHCGVPKYIMNKIKMSNRWVQSKFCRLSFLLTPSVW